MQKLLKQYDEASLQQKDLKKIEADIKAESLAIMAQKGVAHSSSSFIPYPRYEDPDFLDRIASKKEFYKVKTPPIKKGTPFEEIVKEKCEPGAFKLTLNQILIKNFLSPYTPYNGLLLFHGVGVGKCFGKGTLIMMSDGSLKRVEDIKLEDYVMGDDSTPRRVMSTVWGSGMLYQVTPSMESGADPYVVNADHVLCLKDDKGTKIDMKLIDYLKVEKEKALYGYQSRLVFFPRQLEAPTNPYDYGVQFAGFPMKPIDCRVKYGSPWVRSRFMAGYIETMGICFYDAFLRLDYHSDVAFVARSIGITCVLRSNFMFLSGHALKNLNLYRSMNYIKTPNTISVTEIGIGEYYGFSVDGNHRFLLADCTVTHNSCTSISIAEQFLNAGTFKKPCLVLSPSNLKENFQKQIFSREKGTQQCTGNTYYKYVLEDPFLTPEAMDRKINKIIKTRYEFMGFQEFAKRVSDIEGINKDRSRYISKIKNEFSDRVIIIDEVHNVRNADSDGNSKIKVKNVPPKLLEIIRHAERVKLVLLSATPMFNEASEIVWLANLLLANDKRTSLTQSQIFDKNGSLTKSGPALLAAAFRGYVSFMRGENPFSFPLRLYGKNQLVGDRVPRLDIFGNKIKEVSKVHKISLYPNYMSKFQTKVYEILEKKETRKIEEDEEEESDSSDEEDEEEVAVASASKSKKTNTVLLQASNIVYPGTEDIGEKGFDACFTSSKNKFFSYKNSEIDGFLGPKKLGTYSNKIKNIIDCILGSIGIIFVYSFYYKGGLIPLALALEHVGFARYGHPNLLQNQRVPPFMINGKQATYAILGSKSEYTSNLEADIEAIRAESNMMGQDIKVVLGTSIAAEGIDFRFIREIHIMEPWYNLNKIEQIIGRAQRYCSHVALPPQQRNVTIYHHVSKIEGRERETIDERAYRIAENKQGVINQVETIMKENSVDCVLNKHALYFDPKQINIKMDVINSQGQVFKNLPVGDTNHAKYNIKCVGKEPKEDQIDETTFGRVFYSDDIQGAIPMISSIFLKDDIKSFTYQQIKTLLPNIAEDVLMYTLDHMLTRKTPIGDQNAFYLLYRSNLYMLQPMQFTDARIPIKDRGIGYQAPIQQNIRLLANNNVPAVKNVLEDPIAFVIGEVAKLKESLGIALPKSYEQACFDFIIDRQTPAMIKSLAAQLNSKSQKYVLQSLVSGHLYLKTQGWVRDPSMNTWFKATTGSQVSPRELARESDIDIALPEDAKLSDYTAYLVVDYNKNISKLKIVESGKASTLGFVCETTSTFTTANVAKAIKDIDNGFSIGEKTGKKTRCVMYEIVLRKGTNKFARPLEATILIERMKAKK